MSNIVGHNADGTPKAWNTADPVGDDNARFSGPDPKYNGYELDAADAKAKDYNGHTPGIFQGGHYPQETEVTAYAYPTVIERLPELAIQISQEIAAHGFPQNEAITRNMLALGEETGEFLGAVRRFYGMARRTGTWDEVLNEWADLIVTAFVTAVALGIPRPMMETALQSKLDVIFSRGWREPAQQELPLENGNG